MATKNLLGGLQSSTAAKPVNQQDEENKNPDGVVYDPAKDPNNQEDVSGESGTNTATDNQPGESIVDEATGLKVDTASNAYESDGIVDGSQGGPGRAGDAEADGHLANLALTSVDEERRAKAAEEMQGRAKNRKRPRTEQEAAEWDEVDDSKRIIAAYKHRDVRHFKVGPFEFQNHLLYIDSEDAHEAFLDIYDGLPPRDQNAIVEYDWQAAQRVEQPVRAARGPMSTRDIKDGKVIRA